MLGQLTRNLLLSLIFTLPLTGHAQSTVDSIRSKLAEAGSLHDSILLYYKIYEIAPQSLRDKTIEDIYELAIRRSDYHTANDALKLASSHYQTNDSIQQVLISRAEKLPDGSEKRATVAYINVRAALNHVQSLSREKRENTLREYLARYSESKDLETYSRIEYLCKLCMYVRLTTSGDLLTKYQKELQTLIDKLPQSDVALKYLFYTQVANSYMVNGVIEEGVDANKTLLKIINDLQKQYDAFGCKFRYYDSTTLQCYTRLLRCHEALTSNEVDDYYDKILSLTTDKPELRKKPAIYYLMAKKRYQEAIPLLKEQLHDDKTDNDDKLYMINALLQAAEAIGDNELMQKALDRSNAMMKEQLENKAAESYKDLQMIYEVNDLKQTNDDLLLTNQQIAINRHKEQLTYSITTLVVLVILLLIVFVLYRRSKKLTSNLTKSNTLISDKRDAIQLAQKDLVEVTNKAKLAKRIKNDFINSMGHEIRTPLEFIVEYSELIANCTDTDRREYIKRFADVISLNSDLLLTLVNDVLDLPSLENAKGRANIMKSSAQTICESAIDNIRDILKHDVKLVFANEGQDDVTIMTDPHRVEEVLINLLTNAVKFTNKGSITLGYNLSDKGDRITFTVTDTGSGVPAGQEESIFSRSGKHDATSLGLYISRLLAKILGGTLSLDKEYHTGAKFIFSIPIL